MHLKNYISDWHSTTPKWRLAFHTQRYNCRFVFKQTQLVLIFIRSHCTGSSMSVWAHLCDWGMEIVTHGSIQMSKGEHVAALQLRSITCISSGGDASYEVVGSPVSHVIFPLPLFTRNSSTMWAVEDGWGQYTQRRKEIAGRIAWAWAGFS